MHIRVNNKLNSFTLEKSIPQGTLAEDLYCGSLKSVKTCDGYSPDQQKSQNFHAELKNQDKEVITCFNAQQYNLLGGLRSSFSEDAHSNMDARQATAA